MIKPCGNKAWIDRDKDNSPEYEQEDKFKFRVHLEGRLVRFIGPVKYILLLLTQISPQLNSPAEFNRAGGVNPVQRGPDSGINASLRQAG